MKAQCRSIFSALLLSVVAASAGAQPAPTLSDDDRSEIQALMGSYARALGECRAENFADLFVPAEHSAARDDAAERRERGPLYCVSSGTLYASGFAGVSLGIARALLDAYVALAAEKTVHRARRPLRESPVVQAQVALGDARLRAARSHLLATLADIEASAQRTGEVTLAQRVRIRQAASYASREGREVGTLVFHAAGAQAIFASGPWERRLRDLHTVSQQLQGRDDHFEAVGRFLLGLPPDSPFI